MLVETHKLSTSTPGYSLYNHDFTLSVDQVWNHDGNAWCWSETQQAPQFQDLFFGEDIQLYLLPPTNAIATKQIHFHLDAAVRKPSFKLLIYIYIYLLSQPQSNPGLNFVSGRQKDKMKNPWLIRLLN